MLVGDVIQAIREAITDQPAVLTPLPSLISVTPTTVAGPTNLLPGTYFCVVTTINPWGETTVSNEKSVTLTGGQNAILVNYSGAFGLIGVNVYLGQVAGAEYVYQPFLDTTGNVTCTLNTAVGANPPARNTAYNPDTDGDSFSAGIVFRWLNDALSLAGQICGGLIDYSGVATVAGQPMYIIPGKWTMIPDVWYDGYPLAPDKTGNFFRRNSITASVLSQVATTLLTDRMMLEVWPQPARTAASSTLASPITATATSLSAVSLSNFLLTNGMVQVDEEIMAYNGMTGSTLPGLIRGLGGRTAVSHASGAPVKELNLFFHGWKLQSVNYTPGSSQTNIVVPDEWKTMLPIYGLARVKLTEQDTQGYMALKKDFTDGIGAWFRSNKVTTGPRQVGDSSNNLEVIPSLGGGWVVP